MVDGLWIIEFSSTLNLFGRGVVVLNNKRLLGGDAGYYYSGNYDTNNNTISAKITVTRFDENSISVFGDIDQFSLTFTGKLHNDEFSAVATVDEQSTFKIQVNGKKKEDI
jgi:hypothetical protein